MNGTQQHALLLRKTDTEGAIRRCGGDEQLYLSCLTMFLDDPTVAQLNAAIAAQSWDDAFTAAHALKGMAGNMGFIPLMHATGRLVILIRGGRLKEIESCMIQVNSHYRNLIDAIRENFIETEMRNHK